jgi:hypothetical protein
MQREVDALTEDQHQQRADHRVRLQRALLIPNDQFPDHWIRSHRDPEYSSLRIAGHPPATRELLVSGEIGGQDGAGPSLRGLLSVNDPWFHMFFLASSCAAALPVACLLPRPFLEMSHAAVSHRDAVGEHDQNHRLNRVRSVRPLD